MLPFLVVSNPHMRKVYNSYAEAFITLNSFDPITNAEEEDKYVLCACARVCIAAAVCRASRSLDSLARLLSQSIQLLQVEFALLNLRLASDPATAY